VHYYSHRGTKLKAAPVIRAITAFHKHAKRYPQFYPPPPSNCGRKCTGCE
jgi:hypothetical protein